ncbi:MAG: hypothetical protein KAS32_10335, partial [Candidatus Peribacteraceae bacterium]|nr:hypothetical protein [Candidatus Peribacteraceae bacterium]
MSGSNPSSQASPNPSPEDNDRQVQIDTVQKELQELKTAIEVPEGSGRVTAINKAAEELSNAMKPILSLSEEDRNEKEVALIKEILNDSKVETVLRDLIERVGTSRTDLQGLAAEVNAGDLTNELAAMEGNPENASTSFVVSFLANVDSVLKKFSSNDSLGERGKGFAQMMHNAMSQFVLATLEKFSSISFFGQKASLLSEVDKMALAKRRLEEDRATLDVDPA